MKKIVPIFRRFWRPTVVLLLLSVVAYALFFHNIGHLTPGYAPRELAAYHQADSIRSIAANPLDAPYKLLVYAGMKAGHHSLIVTRLAAACLAIGVSFVFFVVARYWLGYRVALLTTLLFITSGGLLHIARLGSPLILQAGILVLLAAKIWWDRTKRSAGQNMVLIALLATLLYIPGMIWFIVLASVVMRRRLVAASRSASWVQKGVSVLLILLIAAPLIRAAILQPTLIQVWAGFPASFGAIASIIRQLGEAVMAIGVRATGPADLWLIHAPLLNVIELVLCGLGIYITLRRAPRRRAVFIASAVVIAIVLFGLSGQVALGFMLPLIYLCIGAGLQELLRQWFSVFPRNPFARIWGVLCIIALVFFSILYQSRAYFIAWPHNEHTRSVFTHRTS